MNVINKKDSEKKTKLYENNFERRHPEIASFLKKRSGGPFMRYASMVAKYNASLHKDIPHPCRNFFLSTKSRHGVADVMLDNFWTSLNSGSTFVGSAFSDFEHIADAKTIRLVLKDAVDLEYIYKDRVLDADWTKTKRPTNKRKTIRTYCYFPTPILIKSHTVITQGKLETLSNIDIVSLLDEIKESKKKHQRYLKFHEILDRAIDEMA
tara:strand:- start:11 stop:637 length:627 start_codon:yes stop_codon:yes gene_type:complete